MIALWSRAYLVKNSRTPVNNEATRIRSIMDIPEVDIAYLGDLNEGTYNILKEVKPDLIYLGYDQQALFESINKAIKKKIIKKVEIKFGQPYKPEKFKSSILNKQK